MALNIFTTDSYSSYLNLFPSYGVYVAQEEMDYYITWDSISTIQHFQLSQ